MFASVVPWNVWDPRFLRRGGHRRRRRRTARCARSLTLGNGGTRAPVTKSHLLRGRALVGLRRGGGAFLGGGGGGPLAGGLLGGLDSGALLFLGYAVECQLKPLQRRAVVCELSAARLVSQRESPLLARRLATAQATPIGGIPCRRASGRGGTAPVGGRCSSSSWWARARIEIISRLPRIGGRALPVGAREVFGVHRREGQRPV